MLFWLKRKESAYLPYVIKILNNGSCAKTKILFLLMLYAGTALTQTTAPTQSVSAQAYLRQQERLRLLRLNQESSSDVHLFAAVVTKNVEQIPVNEMPCVKINEIRLIGDSAEKFQWAIKTGNKTVDGTLDMATDRCLGTKGINLVMRRIQNALIARGYVAGRVLLGPQEKLKQGILELALFPGRIRNIRFTPDSDKHATKWNAVPSKVGGLLNLRDMEQALENFKRVPAVETTIQITPAEGADLAPGQSDVVFNWKQQFPLRLNLSVDDAGSKATGKYQGNVTLSYDNPFKLNDLFYVSFNHDLSRDSHVQGMQGYTIHYSLPFDYCLLGFTTSSNQYYQSVAGNTETYIYSGESQNNEIKLSRVMYRNAVRKITLSLSGWTRSAKNFIDDTEVEIQRRRMAGWDLGLSHREFIHTATLDVNFNYRQGTGAFNALPAPEEAFGEGTSRPKIMMFDAELALPFSLSKQYFRYNGTFRQQWNGTQLIPQDYFVIGGRYTVRGFDGENQLSAENGFLIRNDLSMLLGKTNQEFYVGVDYGQVGGANSKNLIGTQLSGGVLGLRGTFKRFSYDLFVGEPFYKPKGFEAPRTVVGFSINMSVF